MQGMYFYADFGSGRIWGLKHDGTNWQNRQVGQGNYTFTTFGEDEAGRLYLGNCYGRIFRIDDGGSAFAPSFSPVGGIRNSQTVVTVTCPTPDAVIRYTTDGRDPTEADPAFVSGDTLTVSSNITFKARAYRSDLLPSAIATARYTMSVASPMFNPPAGPITHGTQVSISCATPEALIRYTLDGSDPQTNSPIYSGPLRIDGNTTVAAKAYRSGYSDSPPRLVFYALVRVATPVFAPAVGPITNG